MEPITRQLLINNTVAIRQQLCMVTLEFRALVNKVAERIEQGCSAEEFAMLKIARDGQRERMFQAGDEWRQALAELAEHNIDLEEALPGYPNDVVEVDTQFIRGIRA